MLDIVDYDKRLLEASEHGNTDIVRMLLELDPSRPIDNSVILCAAKKGPDASAVGPFGHYEMHRIVAVLIS